MNTSDDTRFDEGFEDRVMARFIATAPVAPGGIAMSEAPVLSLDAALQRAGRRVLPWLAAVAAALVLVAGTGDARSTEGAGTDATDVASGVGAPRSWSAYQ